MKNTNLSFQIVIAGLLSFFTIFSINNSIAAESNSLTKARITGTITDKTTGMPLEYAQVALFSLPDSTLIDGTISNSELNGL